MNEIEIVAIGSEILKGNIVNSNSSEISHALLEAGYKVSRHTVLPDETLPLKKGLEEACKRSRIVITTGGLGPTCDDITRQVAAELFHSDFYFNEELAQSLIQRYGSLPISLENQATVPSKAQILRNNVGTAPGSAFHTETNTLILMPGVPKEMLLMLNNEAIPFLQKHFPKKQYTSSRLFFADLGEANIDPHLRELQKQFPHMEFGIYPAQGIVTVQFMIEEMDYEKARIELEIASEYLRSRFPDNHFNSTTGKPEVDIQQLFIDNKWTLSTTESCTGGAVAARITKQPGASKYFLGGIVSYSNDLKTKLLHVSEQTLSTYGAVSSQTVTEMAIGALITTKSDFALAVSGVAGPDGGSEQNPVGNVWLAIAQRKHEPIAWHIQGYGSREMIIERSVNAVLTGLLRILQGKNIQYMKT